MKMLQDGEPEHRVRGQHQSGTYRHDPGPGQRFGGTGEYHQLQGQERGTDGSPDGQWEHRGQ